MWQVTQSIKSPTKQLFWQVSIDFIFLTTWTLNKHPSNSQEVQSPLNSPSTLLLTGFPKFMWQVTQSIKSPTKQLFWQVSMDFIVLTTWTLNKHPSNSQEVQSPLNSPSTLLLTGFPKFMWQVTQRIKSPTKQLFWQVSIDFIVLTTWTLNKHPSNSHASHRNIVSRWRERFKKTNSAIVFQAAALYSDCSSEASTSAANLLGSVSSLCRSNLSFLAAWVPPPLRYNPHPKNLCISSKITVYQI